MRSERSDVQMLGPVSSNTFSSHTSYRVGDTHLLSVLQRPRALMRDIPKRGEREGNQLSTTTKLECGLGISLLSLNQGWQGGVTREWHK